MRGSNRRTPAFLPLTSFNKKELFDGQLSQTSKSPDCGKLLHRSSYLLDAVTLFLG